jgi:hypothetical protein
VTTKSKAKPNTLGRASNMDYAQKANGTKSTSMSPFRDDEGEEKMHKEILQIKLRNGLDE